MKKSLKIIFLTLFCVSAFSFVASADTKINITDNIALYGNPKYKKDFTNFEYADPEAPKGGRIVFPDYGSFDSFNPFIFKGTAPATAINYTLNSLGEVPADDYSTVYPLIAEKFEVPEDNSFIGFFINKNAKFSDGSPLTADDVVFSYNSLIEKGAPVYKMYYSDVEKIEKLNDYHVRFYFKENSQNKELPLIVSQFKIFSKKDFENADFSKPPLEPKLGSGPYKIKDFQLGKYVVLERNKDYWAKDLPSQKGRYNFDEIRFDFYQDTTVTLQALFSGNIDIREEYIAKIWVTGYDNDQVKSGKVIKKNFYHRNPAVLQNFSFNTRREKFQDKRVRKAISLAFNFDWSNEKLFYGLYSRIYSYFANSEMAATGLPEGKELKILNQYRDRLDDDVFSKPFQNASHKNSAETRNNLKEAVKLLQDAGYDFVNGKMTNLKTGEPLEVEVISSASNGSVFTRVMLPFIENLRKIGIKMTFRTLETNIFKNRLDSFDYDITIISFPVSKMPGNEQREYWGSHAADVKGSYNYIGIKNPIVDELIEKIITANEKDDYIAHIKAMDRVLLNQYYMIFHWYTSYHRVAYQNKFCHPENKLLVGFLPDLWWAKSAEPNGECR